MHQIVKLKRISSDQSTKKIKDYFFKLRRNIILTIIFVNSVVLGSLLITGNVYFKQKNSYNSTTFLMSIMNDDPELQQNIMPQDPWDYPSLDTNGLSEIGQKPPLNNIKPSYNNPNSVSGNHELLKSSGYHENKKASSDKNSEIIPDTHDSKGPPPVPPVLKPGTDPVYDEITNNIFFPFLNKKKYDPKRIYDFFTIELSSKGSLIKILSDRHANIDTESFAFLIKGAYDKITEGYLSGSDSYYLWRAKKISNDYIISFVNSSYEHSLELNLLCVSLIIFFVCLIVSIVLALPLSRMLVRPVKRAFEIQKRFISDAGHELKTPIAVIGANVEVLESEIPENKWLGYIRSENEHIGKLVTDLLNLARNDTDREKYVIKNFNLSELIERTVLSFEPIVYEQKKKLETDIESKIEIYSDADKVKQILMILLDNALKYTEELAIIKISLKQHGSNRVLSVYNTGDGIAPENLKKVFQRFFRVDSSRCKKTGGSGLGLSIAQSIVNFFNGKITVDSEFGQWVKFTVILPHTPGRKKKYTESY